LKRGAGFTTIPEKLLYHKICKNMDIKKEIKELFIHIFGIDLKFEEDSENPEKTEI
jgi:hypothetical protein